MWSREGCPYCAEASVYLEALRQRRPDVRIVVYDIYRDAGARALKLISGMVVLLLGLALILRPEWLEWGGV